MPYIRCNIHSGLSSEIKRELAQELALTIHETLGSPMPYVHVSICEIPGNEFVESGQVDFKYAKDTRTS